MQLKDLRHQVDSLAKQIKGRENKLSSVQKLYMKEKEMSGNVPMQAPGAYTSNLARQKIASLQRSTQMGAMRPNYGALQRPLTGNAYGSSMMASNPASRAAAMGSRMSAGMGPGAGYGTPGKLPTRAGMSSFPPPSRPLTMQSPGGTARGRYGYPSHYQPPRTPGMNKDLNSGVKYKTSRGNTFNATAPAFTPGAPYMKSKTSNYSSPLGGMGSRGGMSGSAGRGSSATAIHGGNLKSEEWRICWNFNSPRGCRWGDKCQWSHVTFDRQVNHPMTGKPLMNTPNRPGGIDGAGKSRIPASPDEIAKRNQGGAPYRSSNGSTSMSSSTAVIAPPKSKAMPILPPKPKNPPAGGGSGSAAGEAGAATAADKKPAEDEGNDNKAAGDTAEDAPTKPAENTTTGCTPPPPANPVDRPKPSGPVEPDEDSEDSDSDD